MTLDSVKDILYFTVEQKYLNIKKKFLFRPPLPPLLCTVYLHYASIKSLLW